MRGQIFVQDLSVSLIIAIITIFSLIAFMNFHNAEFTHSVRNEHKMAVLERISNKLFLERSYNFNIGSFAVSRQFLDFINDLNDEEKYEEFRNSMGLNREGASYDVKLSILCDDGSSANGGKEGAETVHMRLLTHIDGILCNADMGVSER